MELPVDPLGALRLRVDAAVRAAFPAAGAADAALHRSAHADYQADVALALGKRVRQPPREVAAAIAARLPADEVLAAATVSGPGFINLSLGDGYIGAALAAMREGERLGSPRVASPVTVVIDYSSPNVAKEMHVGNIRSTIIGDALARLLEWQGHTVLRQNHIGDWGTPFGMLIEHLAGERDTAGASPTLKQLVALYQAARARFDADPAFAERARQRVVLLQRGDTGTLALWRWVVDLSMQHATAIYERLGVSLRPEHVAGESLYNAELPGVVAALEEKGLARVSDGAVCVFPPGFTGPEGQPVPLIVRKQDGGYGYAATDLAALRHRAGRLGGRRLVYVVGAPQSQHFAMVFATARLAGWADDSVRLEHVAFGSVLGADRKMLKTRAGSAVSLEALLDEATTRAAGVMARRAPDVGDAERARITEAVGIGAIKYGDLAADRIKDYVFDWDRMLALDGNTAPYLMYAHARSRSILREAGSTGGAIRAAAPAERALALELMQLPGIVDSAAETLHPHRLCQHLYEVAAAFARFYDDCPVLKAAGDERASRLALCDLTARVLERGLGLLGIAAPERM